jgi:hypothetical protein
MMSYRRMDRFSEIRALKIKLGLVRSFASTLIVVFIERDVLHINRAAR